MHRDGNPQSGASVKHLSQEVLDTFEEQLGADRKDPYLTEFESVRLAQILGALPGNEQLEILDFGYLKGMVPKVILTFRNARYHVLDHPHAGYFSDAAEQARAHQLGIKVTPCDLRNLSELKGFLAQGSLFDVIILGEIVEHLDPTNVADLFMLLAQGLRPSGRMIITTPNLFGIANVARLFVGKDVQEIPLGHEVMIQGHIHLWSPTMLRALLTASGLVPVKTFYYHGLEGTQFKQSNKVWRSLSYQIWHKCLRMLAGLRSPWRGFVVITAHKPAA